MQMHFLARASGTLPIELSVQNAEYFSREPGMSVCPDGAMPRVDQACAPAPARIYAGCRKCHSEIDPASRKRAIGEARQHYACILRSCDRNVGSDRSDRPTL